MTIFNLLYKKTKYRPHEPAISWQSSQQKITLTNLELWEEFKKVISFFKSINITPGQKIGICANTSGYWHLADLGIMAIGCTSVPIYPTASQDEINYILKDSDVTTLILEDEGTKKRLPSLSKEITTLYINEPNSEDTFLKYRKEKNLEDKYVLELIESVSNKYPASIIYTSGTTSSPKGVITESSAIYEVLQGIAKQMKGKVKKGDTSLTSLPLSHVLGRCDSLLHLCLPIHTYFGESPKSFMNDLKASQPHYIITVPRILEKIKERIEALSKNKPRYVKNLYSFNFSIASSYFDKIDNGITPSKLETNLFISVQKYFFSKIRNKISPNLKFLVSGGAKLSPVTYNFFRNIGIPILEGYGLTETFGPAFINSQFGCPSGYVGFPIDGIKMKFAKDGEILLKGKSVFQEYAGIDGDDYFDKNGFFKTGDIGQWSISKGLKITDRKKDIIVTSGGKNIAPVKIETLMSACPSISHFMLVGDSRKYLTGLISINKEDFSALIEQGKVPPGIDHDQLTQHPEIMALVESEVQGVNEGLASYEKVKKFYIIPVSISQGSIYLSTSLKLKKGKLFNKYIKEIDAMY